MRHNKNQNINNQQYYQQPPYQQPYPQQPYMQAPYPQPVYQQPVYPGYQQTNIQWQEVPQHPIDPETLRKSTKLFKNERNWLIVKSVIWTLLMLAAFGVTGLFGYCTTHPEKANIIPNFSPYYLIPLGILDIISLVFWIITLTKLANWNRILNVALQGKSNLNATNFVKGFFKSSIKWNVSINWFCGYIYFLWLVGILFAFVASYFVGIYVFGGKAGPAFGTVDWSTHTPENVVVTEPLTATELVFAKLPLYTLIGGAAVVFCMIIVQVANILVFKLRKKALYTHFGDIFSYETYSSILAKANKVNFIIYSSLTLIFIVTMVLFFVFANKILKKK